MRGLAVLMIGAGIGLLTLAELFPARPARADEAMDQHGKLLRGEVKLGADGRLRLVMDKSAVRLEDVARVRFPIGTPAPLRAATVHRVTLSGGQFLTGELLDLDAKDLRLRTSWAGRLMVPRSAVVAVGHPPGWVTRFADEFESDLNAWQRTGNPELSDRRATSGKRSLCLKAAGQSVEHILAVPLPAGRARVQFYDALDTSGGRWVVEAEFDGPKIPQVVRVVIGGDGKTYRAEVPAGAMSDPVPRKEGWHQLSVEFRPERWIVSVDDLVLWPPAEPRAPAGAKPAPSGPLHKIRFACVPAGNGAVRGAVWFDDFSLAEAMDDPPHRIADAGQDEVWLLSGDQLFGHVSRADRRTLDLRGKLGTRTLGWDTVHTIFLRREAPPPSITEGEHVRLGLRSGVGAGLDEIDGVVRLFDPRRLSVRHARLGELEIDPARLGQLRWLFHGRRIELDNGFHHLGRKLVPSMQVPRPEGLQLRRTFRLGETVPADARLVVSVVQLKGPGDGPEMARVLERGGLRTEVVLNGQVVDYLNRYGERSSSQPRRLRVPLPRHVLRAGENELILRQSADRLTGRIEDCGVFELAVEVPR